MSPLIIPLVRRAILDLLADIGGDHSHVELTLLLNELGHRLAARDVRLELLWLADAKLLIAEEQEHYTAARITADGLDVAAGRLVVDGVSPHKTGE
jgi:tRNA A22 N-methylase